MCYHCYEKYGKPTIDTPQVRHAAELIGRVYEHSCVGGNLHVAIDDWKLNDECLIDCARFIEENHHSVDDEGRENERLCLAALQALSEDERISALAIVDDFFVLVA